MIFEMKTIFWNEFLRYDKKKAQKAAFATYKFGANPAHGALSFQPGLGIEDKKGGDKYRFFTFSETLNHPKFSFRY